MKVSIFIVVLVSYVAVSAAFRVSESDKKRPFDLTDREFLKTKNFLQDFDHDDEKYPNVERISKISSKVPRSRKATPVKKHHQIVKKVSKEIKPRGYVSEPKRQLIVERPEFKIPKKTREFKKGKRDEVVPHKRLGEANGQLRKMGKKLQPDEFESSYDKLEKKANYMKHGNRLMNNGFKKIDGRQLQKPFEGMISEYDELEDNFDELNSHEKHLDSVDFSTAERHLQKQTGRLAQGNTMMDDGFEHMENMELSPRFNHLHSEFGRLNQGRGRLEESEDYLKEINFDEGYDRLDNEGGRMNDGQLIMDTQFDNLHRTDLSSQYDALEDQYDSLDDNHASIGAYGSQLKNFDFQSGFNFMNKEMGNFGAAGQETRKSEQSGGFTGFMPSPMGGFGSFNY